MRIIIWKRILTCDRKKRGGTEMLTYMLMCQLSLGAMAVTATGHEQLIVVFRKLALCVLLYSLSLSLFLSHTLSSVGFHGQTFESSLNSLCPHSPSIHCVTCCNLVSVPDTPLKLCLPRSLITFDRQIQWKLFCLYLT